MRQELVHEHMAFNNSLAKCLDSIACMNQKELAQQVKQVDDLRRAYNREGKVLLVEDDGSGPCLVTYDKSQYLSGYSENSNETESIQYKNASLIRRLSSSLMSFYRGHIKQRKEDSSAYNEIVHLRHIMSTKTEQDVLNTHDWLQSIKVYDSSKKPLK